MHCPQKFFNPFYLWGGKKYCGSSVNGYGCTYQPVDGREYQDELERKRNDMIRISKLTKKYGDTVIFSHLNCTFENFCIYGLVGKMEKGRRHI